MFAVKKYKDLLEDMVTWVIANQDKITDFNEGSLVRTLLEAMALAAEQIYIKGRIGFEDGLKEVPFYAFKFEKDVAAYSAGTVVFSRAGSSGTVDIPINTLISTTDGLQFQTTAAGEITDGNNDSAAIAIQAMKSGTLYNVAAATIVIIVSPITGVDTVTNASGTSGGLDAETDVEFLERFQQHIEGLSKSNESGLIAGAKSVEGVRSASVIEHFPPSSSYNATVYIDDGAGNAPQVLLDAVIAILIGEGTETDPGYKAGGVNIRVLAPTKVTITVTVEVDEDGSVAREVLEYIVENAITDYINNLLIGEDCIRNKIIEAIMGVSGVGDIDVTVPASNTSISDVQIARVGVITITWA